jgi:DNA phosphorothioation-dependent restriction protein DptG
MLSSLWDMHTYYEELNGEEMYSKQDLSILTDKIKEWHHDRNLIEGSTDKDQFHKLIQECAELSDNLCKGKDIRDDIGDIYVVLVNIAERNKLSMEECISEAYNDIKDRKGRMVDGVFIKEKDL